jgi:hypothetical protein
MNRRLSGVTGERRHDDADDLEAKYARRDSNPRLRLIRPVLFGPIVRLSLAARRLFDGQTVWGPMSLATIWDAHVPKPYSRSGRRGK